MSDTGQEAKQVPLDEQCEATLRHYDHVSTVAHEWNNQVPQAIKAWYAAKGAQPSERATPIPPIGPVAAEVTKALRELADGYFRDPMGEKQELTIFGRTMRESIVAQALARLSARSATAAPQREALDLLIEVTQHGAFRMGSNLAERIENYVKSCTGSAA